MILLQVSMLTLCYNQHTPLLSLDKMPSSTASPLQVHLLPPSPGHVTPPPSTTLATRCCRTGVCWCRRWSLVIRRPITALPPTLSWAYPESVKAQYSPLLVRHMEIRAETKGCGLAIEGCPCSWLAEGTRRASWGHPQG